MKNKLIIFGIRSTAIELAEVVKEYYNSKFSDIVLLFVDKERKDKGNKLHIPEIDIHLSNNKCNYIISFADIMLRVEVEKIMKKKGINPVNIIHPKSIISKTSKMGYGNYVAANVVISSNAIINNHNIINYNATIGHDVVMEDHIIVNPSACISGNVYIGSRVLVGANSFVFQGKKIGNDTLIDAMTYIDRDIDCNMICSSKQLKTYKRVK